MKEVAIENIVIGFFTVIVGIMMVGAIIGVSYDVYNMPTKCLVAWRDYNPEYSRSTGCTIVVDGKRIPSESYKVQDFRIK